jgi:undecaprenyl-diphosphatase
MDFLGRLDLDVLRWFQAQHAPWLNAGVINLTDLGHRYVVTVVALLAAAGFLARRQYRAALLMVAAALACWCLIEGIKRTVRRLRPPKEGLQHVEPSLLTRALGAVEKRPVGDLPPVTHAERTYSFPSGHALSSAAVYLTLALLAARRLRRRGARVLVIVAAALLVFAIGVSRLYLGAHYLTDVLAGWAAGVGCALVCVWVDERWEPRGAGAGPAAPA